LGLTATLPFVRIANKRAATYVRRLAVSTEVTARAQARGEILAQISTRLVQLHSRYYGKGPTKAKTHFVNDTVICILRGGFTTVERTLIDTGRVDPVMRMRHGFQQAMENEFRTVVEDATGRKVIAYMSTVHIDPDLAVELFVLEPIEDAAEGPWTSETDSAAVPSSAAPPDA
jgi:uncharacterized protein YbcI